MARIVINLPKKKAKRLGKHLLEEHPITRGKLLVGGKKIKRIKKIK